MASPGEHGRWETRRREHNRSRSGRRAHLRWFFIVSTLEAEGDTRVLVTLSIVPFAMGILRHGPEAMPVREALGVPD